MLDLKKKLKFNNTIVKINNLLFIVLNFSSFY